MTNYTKKKKNTLAKALLVALSVLCLAFGFGQSTLSARAAEDTDIDFEDLGLDTHPDDVMI